VEVKVAVLIKAVPLRAHPGNRPMQHSDRERDMQTGEMKVN
jgi:hypothetical protein